MRALETSPLPEARPLKKRTDANLIAAVQASPYQVIEIEACPLSHAGA
jgi:hypothetical protein